MTITINASQARLIQQALDELRRSVWDDPSCFGFERDEITGEVNENEIEVWQKENITSITDQLKDA